MSEAQRPLPNVEDADTGEFWRKTSRHELAYPQCADCAGIVFYPRQHCPQCGSSSLNWQLASGTGSIYSFSVVRQSYHPFFRTQAPYAVAWIDLDEGVRLLSNVIGVEDPGSQLSIGQRVMVTWEEHDELCIPLFRPL